MRYENAQHIALGFLFFYAFVGMYGHVTRENAEDLYPFFSWSLFAQVPERIQEGFEMYVVKVAGKPLPDAAPVRDVPGVLGESVNYQMYAHLASEFGRALVAGEDARARNAREALEALLTTDVTYEMRATHFNPLEKFLTGAILSSTVLGRFDSDHKEL